MISKKHKKTCTILNYIEFFIILAFAVTGCVSISTFNYLVGIPIGIAIFVVGLIIWAKNREIKKYNTQVYNLISVQQITRL